MYTGFIHLHALLRWVLVVLAVVVPVLLVLRQQQGGAYPRKLVASFLGLFHVNVLVGLVLWLALSPISKAFFDDVGGGMKNANLRFYGMEHALLMLVAAVVATVGSARARRAQTDAAKIKTALVFFGIAIVQMLVAIPWPFRGEIGRALLPF
jgi:hypothetical protein